MYLIIAAVIWTLFFLGPDGRPNKVEDFSTAQECLDYAAEQNKQESVDNHPGVLGVVCLKTIPREEQLPQDDPKRKFQ